MIHTPPSWPIRALLAISMSLAVAACGPKPVHALKMETGDKPASDVATGERAMVATAHPLATAAGLEIIDAGGNAVDAAVAVSFALSVVEPWSSGIGGGAFMVVHSGGKTTTWDMREMAPAAATRDMFVKDGRVVKGASIWTARAAGIPGLVRGLVTVHGRFGKLPLDRVMAPAIRLAKDGFPATERMNEAVGQTRGRMNEAARKIFLTPDGKAPKAGTVIKQADLAKTLEAIAKTKGEAFYTGGVARELVRAVKAEGGLWTLDDLKNYVVKERPPVRGEYRGHEIVSMGPPSSGGLLLVQMLEVMGRFETDPKGWSQVPWIHRLTETMKRAYAMRAVDLGDPDFAKVDRDEFIGKATISRIAGEVKAAKKATPAGEIAKLPVKKGESTHTSHFSIIVGDDAVACTQTINLRFGNARVAGATGVVLNNEMDDFSAQPGVPNAFGLVGAEANAIAPGKRPLSSMTPTLVFDKGKVVGVFGSPGGSRIITTTLQSILNVVDFRMNAAQAIARPRLHHQWFPDALFYEPGRLTAEQREALKALGHDVRPAPFGIGNAMAVWRRADGTLTGAADPRGEGTATGR